MTFDDYQKLAAKTAIYSGRGSFSGLAYCTLGLTGEAGEVANKVKKIWRDPGTRESRLLMKELGDVLWYLAEVASNLNVSLDEIAVENINKLSTRQQNNTLHGSGDIR